MISYGQFCPVAKAAEVLGERWTLLVVRELLLGTTRFSQLQKALAKASPSILTKRLKELEQAGIVAKQRRPGNGHAEYTLTRAGQELGGLVEQMGLWAVRWAPGRLGKDELEEYFLMLDVSRRVRVDRLPARSATLGFQFGRARQQPDWWLVVREGEPDICDSDPGYELDVMIGATLRNFVSLWLGHTTLKAARRSKRVRIAGDPAMVRTVDDWLGYSAYAEAARAERSSGSRGDGRSRRR